MPLDTRSSRGFASWRWSACSSPTSPTSLASAPPPQISASHTTIRPGDTVAFVLSGVAPDRRIFWQFTTSDLAPIAFVPVVVDPGGEAQTAIDTHRTVIRIVRIGQPTRFIAEAWSIPGFSDNPPAGLDRKPRHRRPSLAQRWVQGRSGTLER